MKYLAFILITFFAFTYPFGKHLQYEVPATEKQFETLYNQVLAPDAENKKLMFKTYEYLKNFEEHNPIEFLDFVNFFKKKLRQKEKDDNFTKFEKVMYIIDELSSIDDDNNYVNQCLNYLEL